MTNWTETTAENFNSQLGSMMPAAGNGRRAFACGEPLQVTAKGNIHQVFVYCCNRYFTAERLLSEFDAEKYAEEVFQQFFETKLTLEQVENWRKVLFTQIGSYALIISENEIEAYKNKLQKEIE